MTMKHTPGPWGWQHNSSSDASTVCIEVRPNGPYRGTVADLQSCEHILGITMAETEANARLISAAPDLLEALEKLNAAYDRLKPPGYPKTDGQKLADAAIAKARGAQ